MTILRIVGRTRPGRKASGQAPTGPADCPWKGALSEAEQGGGVAGDHPFLVGGNHPGGDAAPRLADQPRAHAVARRIELDAEPAAAPRYGCAYLPPMLADAAGEDQGVEAAERRRE